MITVLDDEKFVLRNYETMADVSVDDCFHIMVEYNLSLDRKPVIEWCTSSDPFIACDEYGFAKDVEIDNEAYERYLAIMEY